MNIEDIEKSDIWKLYEKGRNFLRLMNVYADTDRNYRFYNGNQWEGVKLAGVEPVQKNFIKPIVKYKQAVIHSNLYAINYSSQNFESAEFNKEAEKYCQMLNRYAARIWEKDKMDFKGRKITKDAAVNDEGILYVYFDESIMLPVNEIIKKNDIYYGNENDEDIQSQPYILIRKRMPVVNAVELAMSQGLSEEKTQFIVGDKDNFEESGQAAKYELDDMVTIIYKLYKKKGTVHFSVATKWVTIAEDKDTGLNLYPVAHFTWEEKEGSARGEGEVRYLIPNQIEVNKTEMRRVLTVKSQAYPHKVVNVNKVQNPDALNTVGGIIKTDDASVDDVNKAVGIITPAQMSPDVKALQDDLISMSRELAGAGEAASGSVDPQDASGRAILAVQQASQAPMTEQKEAYKNFIEDVAKIWLEFLIVNSANGINMEQEVTDPETGEEVIKIVNVPQSVLEKLKATVKVDITPKSPYDRFAQEQTIENLLVQGYFNSQRVGELEKYAEALDDDSVAPKIKIMDIVDKIKEEQKKIAMLDARAQMVQQNVNRFMNEDVHAQASQLMDAQRMQSSQMDDNPDDN